MTESRRSRTGIPLLLTALLAALLWAGAAHANLRVFVEARPDPVQPGETMHVVFHVSNDGATALSTVTLESTVPAEVDAFPENWVTGIANCNAGDASLCEPGEIISWSLGTLDPGEGLTVSYPGPIASGGSAPANGTIITIPATVNHFSGTPVVNSGTAIVDSAPVLDFALSADRHPVLPDTLLTYRLDYGNVDTSATASAVISALGC